MVANNLVDTADLVDTRIGADVEVVGGGRHNHDADGGVERDEDRELDEKCQDRVERLDIVALIEIHHLEGFELTIAVAILFDLGELGLNFAHEAGLMHLALDEGPEADFDEHGEENNGETKIADEAIDYEKDIGDWANNQHVN